MPPDSPNRRATFAVWLLLALHTALGVHTAKSKSVTHDELWHLPVGLINLTQQRFGADNLNPPLTRMWAAVPLAAAGQRGDGEATGPAVGSRFIEAHREVFQRWYVWGRVFNLAFSVATGWLLARWARELWGTAAQLGAALLYVTCPNVLAHASIVTPDAGLMLGFVASLYLFWRWTERPTWGMAITLGVVLGLTQATKYTAVLLYPVLGAVCGGVLVAARRQAKTVLDEPERQTQLASLRRMLWQQFPVAILISLLVLNAVYLFQGTGRRLGDYAFQSRALAGIKEALGVLNWLPVPFPRDYLEGLDAQRAIMEGQHPVFLDGQWSVTGFPAYYPKTLLYKLPHPLQLLAIVGLLATWLAGASRQGGRGSRRARPIGKLAIHRGSAGASPSHHADIDVSNPSSAGRLRIPWRVHALIGLTAAVLLGTAATTSMQLGVRYILPLLPLIMLYGAGACAWIAGWPRLVRVPAIVLVVLACGASLRFHPHHLAYFNEFAGGPVGGREHLLDSNIDWGQDLNLVRDFMRDHNLPTIGLAYFGTLHPQDVGIEYTVPPGYTPKTAGTFRLPPGWYAVSVNFVMGRPHLIHTPDGRDPPVDINEFGYFRQLEPVARLGYSIDVYHVDRGDLR